MERPLHLERAEVFQYLNDSSEVGSRRRWFGSIDAVLSSSPPLRLSVLLLFTQILSSMPTENTSDFENLREKFGRARILIVGRANAGKTTILRAICNTTENSKIYDGDGNEVRTPVDVCRRVYAKPRARSIRPRSRHPGVVSLHVELKHDAKVIIYPL